MGLPSELPIIQAPMAGGPSTPALTAAVANAGGYGFVAAGYLSAEGLERVIATTRELTSSPFGVNLFVPSQPGDPVEVAAYAEVLQPEAERLGATLGEPRWDDDAYDEKLDVVESAQVHLVSFTFGCPTSAVVERLHGGNIQVAVTVTSVLEAQMAVDAGTDLLAVQGTEAGGHQGSFVDVDVNHSPLLAVLGQIREATHVPMIGTGGVMTGHDAALVLGAGAIAVQVGTAFLCTPEAGTSAPYRQALLDGRYPDTILTALTADDLLEDWRTGSRSSTTGRPRRPTRRYITSLDRSAPQQLWPATPTCPISGPVLAGAS